MEKEFIEAFFDEVKITSAELQAVGMDLACSQFVNSDPLIDQIFAETASAEDIVIAFEKYFKETRDFSILKMEILGILEPKKKKNSDIFSSFGVKTEKADEKTDEKKDDNKLTNFFDFTRDL